MDWADLRAANALAPPSVVFGLVRARAADRLVRLRRFDLGRDEADDFVRLCRIALARDVEPEDVATRTEGQWLTRFLRQTRVTADDLPADWAADESPRRPKAMVVPTRVGTESVVFIFPISDGLKARVGGSWLSLVLSREGVRETRLAAEDEQEWQVSEAPIAIAIPGPPPLVMVEARPDMPTRLAELFDQLDPSARSAAGEALSNRVSVAFEGIDAGRLRLSEGAKATLAAAARSNLAFASRLEKAYGLNRWTRLTNNRIEAELSGASGARWGVDAGHVRRVDGVLELDVDSATTLRIVRDAFSQSILNQEDLIEGEGRPAEDPDLLA